MPNNLKTYKISDFIDINPLVKLKANESYSFVEMKDLDSNNRTVLPSNFKTLNGGARFQNDDTLFARITPCLQNGKICQVKGLTENVGFGSTEFLVFRGKKGVSDTNFVYYLSREPFFRQFAENNMIGTSGRQRVAKQAFQNLELALPPLNEQQAIASILSTIDDKIENNLAINKTLEEMAMALYKHWFVDFGPFQDGDFVESELGLIPKGWEVKNFFDLFTLLSGGTPKTSVAEYWNGNINWVSAKDIGSNNNSFYINDTEKKVTDLGIKKSAAKILLEDTVIVVARGSVGKYGMLSKAMAINQSCYGIYSKSNYSQPVTYLLIQSLMNHFMQVSYGSVFDTITTSTFQNINILLPPASVLNNIKNNIDEYFTQIKCNVVENQALTELRNTLLPSLISGEIRLKEFRKEVSTIL